MHTQQQKLIGTGVIALIIGIGIGYAGAGMITQPSTTGAAGSRGSFAANGATRGMGAGTGGGILSGTVAAQDSGSITLNTRDGSSHVVLITPDTTVSKSVNGTLSDITTGSTVIVSGTTNSDGSVSANLIQLRPATTPQPQ